jgi:hypothetical protein
VAGEVSRGAGNEDSAVGCNRQARRKARCNHRLHRLRRF